MCVRSKNAASTVFNQEFDEHPDKICASVQRTQQAQSLIKNLMSQSRVKNEHPDKICASVQRTQQAQSLIKNLMNDPFL